VASHAVSEATDVTAIAISIAISKGATLLPSAAYPVSRPCLLLTLNLVITSVRHTSSRVILVFACLLADARGRLCDLPRLSLNALNCADYCAHPPQAVQKALVGLLWGQFDVQDRLLPSVFQLLSLLSTHCAVSVSPRLSYDGMFRWTYTCCRRLIAGDTVKQAFIVCHVYGV